MIAALADARPFPRLAAETGPGAPPSPAFLALSGLAFAWARAEADTLLYAPGSHAGMAADRRARAAEVEFRRAEGEVPAADGAAARRLAEATRARIDADLAAEVADLRRAIGYAEMPGGFPDHAPGLGIGAGKAVPR